MKEVIKDLDKITSLYREGKISRVTYWRAKKRGWIHYNYHAPTDLGGEKMIDDNYVFLYSVCRKYAGNIFNKYKLKIYNVTTEKGIINDLAGDVFVKVLERNPKNLKEAFKKASYLARQLASRSNAYYTKYMFVPDSKEHRQTKEVYYIEDLKEKGVEI